MKTKILFITLAFFLISSCADHSNLEDKKEISPYLFGQNLWLTAGSEGRPGYIQEFLWPKVKESGAKIIRIGGNGYDQNLPGYDTLEMWVKSIKGIGAEPMMQISKYESAEKAAELVKHFNTVSDELYIKYWAMGNEPYQIHKWSIDSISKMIRSHSSAMKAVDPKIKVFAPDAAAYYNDLYEALLLSDRYSVAGRDENGNWYIDGITFHNYPNAKNYSRSDVIFYSVSKMRGMMLDLVSDLEASNKKYQRFGKDALTWGLTEFNITYNNPDYAGVDGISVRSFINGQFWIDVFGMSMEYGAFCVTPWCIQESDRARTYFGYLGGPPDFTPHSTFYHMKLMSESMQGNYIKILCENPYVKAYASGDGKKTSIILMNQSENESFNLDLSENGKLNPPDDILGISSSVRIKANYKGKLEANSTLLLEFDAGGKKTREVLYSLEMAVKNLPPEEK